MLEKVNQSEMADIERRDFLDAEKALGLIYGDMVMEQAPLHSVYDATLEADGKRYIVEIKSRKQDLKYGTFPILLRKYDSLISACPKGWEALYVVLHDGGEAYVYNLSRIRVDECKVRPWLIRRWQLSDDHDREWQMTVFLPFEMAFARAPYLYYKKEEKL